MDIFGRSSKAKGKRDPVAASRSGLTASTSTGSGSSHRRSPSPSPSSHPTSLSSLYGSETSNDDYGHNSGESLRSSQATNSTFSFMSSSDSVNELLATHPDMLTDGQVEARFEKMLTRRGINDPNARAVMLDFSIEKKRLMVSQDIQAETGAMKPSAQAVSRRGIAADTSEKKSPEFYVKKLSEPDMKGIHAKTLAHLSVSLRTMPLSWVRQFIDMRGMQIITAALGVLNKSKHKREVDLQAEGEILRCFKALLNNTVGVREALKCPQSVQEIVYSIVSPSMTNRRLVCEVLVFLCYYKVPVGQELVLKSMDNLRDVRKGYGRFDAWFRELRLSLSGRGRMGSLVGASDDYKQLSAHGSTADSQLCEYTLYNMLLVNAIINIVEDPEMRIHLRNQMNASGLERLMDQMLELRSEQIDIQVREFRMLSENDQDDIMEVYHERVLRDLNDPRDVFECVLASVEGTRSYDFFLSCLQHILLIRDEAELKPRYFQVIDNLITQVVLDHKGLVEDFSATYGTSVQHLIDKFADQDQLQATLEEIRNLQDMYDDLALERDELQRQLEENGGTDGRELAQMREKTASLEDLLRMSRHTISTLQQKLRDLQGEYERDLEAMQNQLDVFYKAVDDSRDDDDEDDDGDIIISRSSFAKAVGRIRAHESLEGKSSKEDEGGDTSATKDTESTKTNEDKYKSMAVSLSEEFKNQLAMQFGSSSGLADFVVPGSMPLMGSSARWGNARRRNNPIRPMAARNTSAGDDDSVVSPTMTLQEELKANFSNFGRSSTMGSRRSSGCSVEHNIRPSARKASTSDGDSALSPTISLQDELKANFASFAGSSFAGSKRSSTSSIERTNDDSESDGDEFDIDQYSRFSQRRKLSSDKSRPPQLSLKLDGDSLATSQFLDDTSLQSPESRQNSHVSTESIRIDTDAVLNTSTRRSRYNSSASSVGTDTRHSSELISTKEEDEPEKSLRDVPTTAHRQYPLEHYGLSPDGDNDEEQVFTRNRLNSGSSLRTARRFSSETSSKQQNISRQEQLSAHSTITPPPPPPPPPIFPSISSPTPKQDTNTSDVSVPSIDSATTAAPPPPPPPPPPILPSVASLNQDAATTGSSTVSNSTTGIPPPPPPPPPPPGSGPPSSTPSSSEEKSSKPPSPEAPSAPPAPPPPPPNAPAPPTGMAVAPRKAMNHIAGVKLRALQWQKMTMDRLNKTVWMLNNEDDDASLESKLDMEGVFSQMEEMFAQKIIAKANRAKKEVKQEICILDSRKAHIINIAILAKLKHIPFSEAKNKILAIDDRFCTEILLKNLLANAPTPDEMGKLTVFLKTAPEEDLQNLSKSDAFCAEIITIPRFKERFDTMLFRVTFSERISQLGKNMANVMDASTSLKESKAFKDLLSLVLMVGNFLNGTNFQGGAFGIRIASINKIVDTKSSSNETTLLHFLVGMIEQKFPDISETLLDDLQLCGEACRVTIQDLIKDYNELRVGLQKLIHELERYESDQENIPENDRFLEVMTAFRDTAIEKFDQLEVRYTSMDIAYKDVVTYFGENPRDMKPDEFFGVFKTFTSSWERARADIIAQRKKMEQLERAKHFEEQRKEHAKRARKQSSELHGEDNEAQDAKDIMDTLLHKLRSGELSSAAKRRSMNSRRMSMAARRERRRTRSESVAMRAEDLLKHIQNEEEPPLPTTPLPTTRSRSGSRKLAASERMLRLASLAEEKTTDSQSDETKDL